MAGTRQINFRAGDLAGELDKRSSPALAPGHIAKRDLGRYYRALENALRSVELTESEASLICDALNGTLIEPHSVPLLWAEVSDAIHHDGLDRKWKVDGTTLISKLQGLSYWQSLALADAVERFWVNPNPMQTALARAGLVRR